jgi:uncharacterized membrane protein YoaK (UPF0700 family)
MVAGYVDSYGFISYNTYLSFMSGNTTQTGSQIGQGNFAATLHSMLAIFFFSIGVFTGTLLKYSGARQLRRLTFGLVALLLIVIIGVTQFCSLNVSIGIMTLSLAMGFMNTTLSHVGAQSMNLVFMTGTLNTMAQHLALAVKRAPLSGAQGSWDTHKHRAFLLMVVWASFLAAAGLAGIATPRLGVWVLLLPALIMLALALFSRDQNAYGDPSA